MSVPPDLAQFPFFDQDGVLAFAHRGGAGYEPNHGIENSMRAFANAIDLGYRYLETDVRATADGVVLAFHDASLDRTTDRSGTIAELPYAEVAKARIGGREPIPRLVELLDAWPRARFNIDVKAPEAVAGFIDAVNQTRSHERVCVASFSWRRLRASRRALGPGTAFSLAPMEVLVQRLAPRLVGRLVLPPAPCVQVPVEYGGLRIVNADFVETAHALGRHVHVWTIDNRDEMTELLDLGVDGIVTDRIDTLREVLMARGQW